MHQELIDEFYIWRLVCWEKCASLQELEETWSVRDVLKANAFLDFKYDIEDSMYGSHNSGAINKGRL